MDALRLVRIGGALVAVWGVLFLRFAAGIITPTEADAYVHWALLPIALLIAAANGGMEMNGTGSVPRRDVMWGLSAALASFAILRLARIV